MNLHPLHWKQSPNHWATTQVPLLQFLTSSLNLASCISCPCCLLFFIFLTVNKFSLIFSNENQSDGLQYTVLILVLHSLFQAAQPSHRLWGQGKNSPGMWEIQEILNIHLQFFFFTITKGKMFKRIMYIKSIFREI